MTQDSIKIEVNISTHKRLKLLSIIEKQTIVELLDSLVKERYGERRGDIEELISSANKPTQLKDDR
jgi:hypothetical protein